ncbi:sulfatase [Stratiformator vulcanicus]|uniref:Arylsulfatase n=1 Tax=Stratiformator vulcanicus TaxID=2527980 RepID=A0A517R0R8_9PLAN|nr:sulfatase [Stratiformator vulcanicus]QDT37489.1 Arylsulfatase [Stratiformator vulcanicus]
MLRLIVAFAFLGLSHQLVMAAERPSVVLFLVDDLGWTDLGYAGSDLYQTPNIDRLAAEGVQFTNAYAACNVCSPTRAAVLTGKYPARLNLTDYIEGHTWITNRKLELPDWTKKLPIEEVTIADVLSEAGYQTAHIGKWHLSPRSVEGRIGYLPTDQGFDVNVGGGHMGLPGSYFYPYGRGGRQVPYLPEGGKKGDYLTDLLAGEACKLIESWKDEPFFINYWFYTVHTPIQGKPDYIENISPTVKRESVHHNAGYAAMVRSLDDAVGRVLDTLEQNGLAEETLIIFTSDNGGLDKSGRGPTSNHPLRQGKGTVYEGGVRVPAIIKMPGITKAGGVCHEPIISVDYLPTVLELLALNEELPAEVDGSSLVPLLRDPDVNLEREAIYWHYPHYHAVGARPHGAVRSGKYKLIEFYEDDRLELYDLETDIHEDHNLAMERPAIAQRLYHLLDRWRGEVGAQMGAPNPEYDPSQATGRKTDAGITPLPPVREH